MRKVVVGILMFIGIFCTGFSRPVSENTGEEVGMEEKTIVDEMKDDNGRVILRCSLAYPQIIGTTDSKQVQKINRELEEYFVSRFQKDCTEVKSYVTEFIDELDNRKGDVTNFIPFVVDISYTTTFNRNELVSYRITNYQWSGGAHPNTTQDSITYDLRTGNKVEATDLLKLSEEQIKEFIAQAFEKKEEVEPGTLFPEAIELLKSHKFEYSFYLNSDGMVFYFNPYVISPYAVGIVSVSLPYASGREFYQDSNRLLKHKSYGSTFA